MTEQGHGPVYGVKLIDTLPLGSGILQQMASERDLRDIMEKSSCGERVAAAYEVLLDRYQKFLESLQRIKAAFDAEKEKNDARSSPDSE